MRKGNTFTRPHYSGSGMPGFVRHDSRICFGIDYFDSEENAQAAHVAVRASGRTYNGGWFDGMPCGRDTGFDYVNDGQKFYAVTC